MAQWTRNTDGEYNEHTATINGKQVTVFSDRDAERWECYIDDDTYVLEATHRKAAFAEAERYAKE